VPVGRLGASRPSAPGKEPWSETVIRKTDLLNSSLHSIKGKNPAAVELGRLGGKKDGKARAEKMTAS